MASWAIAHDANRRPPVRVALGVAVAALGLGLGLAAWRDLRSVQQSIEMARMSLQGAVADPAALTTAEGRSRAIKGMDAAAADIDHAASTASGSLPLRVAGLVPGLATQRAGLIHLVGDAGHAAAAGRNLVIGLDGLGDHAQLRHGQVPVEALGEVGGQLRVLGNELAGVARSPAGLWFGLHDARARFDRAIGTAERRAADGADAAGAARSFLGDPTARRYLLALQNNAEMRDQGMVLAFSVLRFDGGHLTAERSGTIHDLEPQRPASTSIPDGTAEVFGFLHPTNVWQSVNATADFTWSARAMADMFRADTGDTVDGVIALDVPGLAGLLDATGPIAIAGVDEPIGAWNLGRLLLHDFYDGLAPGANQSPRRERQAEVMKAVLDRLATTDVDAGIFATRMRAAASGGHLRLWSAAPSEEGIFERTGLGGGPGTTDPGATFHVAVQNRSVNKLDYYVKSTVHQDVLVHADGSALVRTTVQVDNQAPTHAEPSYQLGPDQFTKNPGDYLAWVLVWGPAGSTQLDGGVAESGLNVAQRVMPVAAGEHREMTFETLVPHAVQGGRLHLRLVPQPRLDPASLAVHVEARGRRIAGPADWHGSWDRVVNLDWRVTPGS